MPPKQPKGKSQQAPSTPTQSSKRTIDETISPTNTDDKSAVEEGDHVRAPHPIRRRNSLSDIADLECESSDAPMKLIHQGKTYNMSQLIQNTLSNKSFINSIAPLIAAGIESHLATMMNKLLQPLLDRITEQCHSIDCLRSELSEKTSLIDSLTGENVVLKSEIKGLKQQVNELERSHDDLEQYGRRTNLRFHNVPMSETDATDSVVLDICNNKLKLSPPVSPGDIERSHTIGQIKQGKAQIICRFKGWKTKFQVYKAKSGLKSCKTDTFNVHVSEDLTKRRLGLVNILANARKAGKIDSYWSSDGRVFYKDTPTSNKILVQSSSQIKHLHGTAQG